MAGNKAAIESLDKKAKTLADRLESIKSLNNLGSTFKSLSEELDVAREDGTLALENPKLTVDTLFSKILKHIKQGIAENIQQQALARTYSHSSFRGYNNNNRGQRNQYDPLNPDQDFTQFDMGEIDETASPVPPQHDGRDDDDGRS